MPNVTPGSDGLAALNALSPPEAERELLSCCAAPAFARRVAAGLPYADAAALAAAAREAVRGLSWPQVLEALSAHPRIGDRAGGGGREASWSRAEQSGTAGADRRVLAQLAAGNVLYEQRFGHVYLVCATGLTAEEMADRLMARVRNDEETERAVVREELAEIAVLRAVKLAAGPGDGDDPGSSSDPADPDPSGPAPDDPDPSGPAPDDPDHGGPDPGGPDPGGPGGSGGRDGGRWASGEGRGGAAGRDGHDGEEGR
ncbi:2-oxo-4-hydroxy-4-carboxy-5-ureidoimidazoline decarboxylase [Sphaerisporangium sp. NPDC005288]|uniref:2-oxo-4-hydroxy-4-carboxy-5-ureidoimidazoline decarboxylase n=1 Tax=Sphaerisporangium sp. NPDC005288 TaxID=3155114 RepID=UPI00339F2FD2